MIIKQNYLRSISLTQVQNENEHNDCCSLRWDCWRKYFFTIGRKGCHEETNVNVRVAIYLILSNGMMIPTRTWRMSWLDKRTVSRRCYHSESIRIITNIPEGWWNLKHPLTKKWAPQTKISCRVVQVAV